MLAQSWHERGPTETMIHAVSHCGSSEYQFAIVCWVVPDVEASSIWQVERLIDDA